MSNKGLTNSLASSKSRAKAQFAPNISTHSFDPTTRDYFNFSIGDIWINKGTISAPLQRVWILVNQANHVATWILLTSGGGGPVIGLQPDIGAVVNPILGIINVHNPPVAIDGNILTQNGTINGDPTNYLDIRLADSISITNNGLFGLRNNSGGVVAVYTPTNVSNQFNVSSNTFNAGVNGSGLNMFHARGTPTAPTATITGDQLGNIAFEGYDGASAIIGAAITSNTSGTIAASRVAGNIQFWTHPDATTSNIPIQRMVLNSSGNLTINQPDVGAGLIINGNSTTAGGIQSFDGTIASYSSTNVAHQFNITSNTFNAGVNSSGLNIFHARGTPTVPLPVVSGDGLGEIAFEGYDGAFAVIGASIRSVSSGTIAVDRVAGNLIFATHPDAVTSVTPIDRMTLSSAGNLTINAPDSGCAITSISTFGQAIAGTGVALFVDAAGLIGTVVSSIKYKENVMDIASESNPVMQLRPVTFNLKKDEIKYKQYGLIAEEVADIMPDLVVYKDAQPESVRYHDLPVLLLNEIQKLNKRIKVLEDLCANKVS